VRDFVQSKIGTTDFSHVWENLRQVTRERREGRREKRNTMAVADPEAFGRRKERRGEMKKEAKKRKVKAFA
jgi:U3 small nucleolar RNA-associated protein 20